jgi:hypothetical protein
MVNECEGLELMGSYNHAISCTDMQSHQLTAEAWLRGRIVGAAAVCKQGAGEKYFPGHLGPEQVKVKNAEQWVMGLAPRELVRKRDRLRTLRVTQVAVIRFLPVTIQ